MADPSILDRLFEVVLQRRRERPSGSYVTKLLEGGLPAVGAKVREEAEELVEAAAAGDADHVAHEAADLVFHAWVLLAAADVPPERVYAVLEGRFGVGGLEEKARRRTPGDRGGAGAC